MAGDSEPRCPRQEREPAWRRHVRAPVPAADLAAYPIAVVDAYHRLIAHDPRYRIERMTTMANTPVQAPAAPPDPFAVGRLTKEQKRNIRRAVGEPATAAIEQCRQIAYQVSVAQAALAKEVVALQGQQTTDRETISRRADGLAKWAETNEGDIKAVRTSAGIENRRLAAFLSMSFVSRIRWVLCGTLPQSQG